MSKEQQKEETSLKGELFENLRALISLIDQLRDLGVSDYIKLPRIAVLGSQSAGKSSLLENIVGLDFLPRGEGIVTRRPLEMRLIHKPEAGKPWAIFENNKDEKFFDFDKVRQNIVDLTDKSTNGTKDINPEPIVMTIFSSDCPDLTLIDLPGITRIPLPGQRADIEKVTLDMAKSYCADERTIILAVCPANQDLSTSDGLKLAMDLDPTGKRTLGVITKIDMMDLGTDARKMLLGQEIPLALGYVGVKNRNQKEINEKVRVAVALEREQNYFKTHPIYSTIPQDLLGTKSLTTKLTNILYKHIKGSLPQIIKEIDGKIKDCELKLLELGPGLPRDKEEKMHTIWNMLTEYTDNLNNQLRGKYDYKIRSKDQSLQGGARIKTIMNKLYEDVSSKTYRASKFYSEKEIREAIKLHQGDTIPGFPSFDSFLYLIMPQLEKLKDPAIEALNEIFTYIDSLSNSILKRVFVRFPTILEEISEISSKVLNDQRVKTQSVVENLIDAELGYIFTNDQDYLTLNASIIPQEDEEKPVQPAQPAQPAQPGQATGQPGQAGQPAAPAPKQQPPPPKREEDPEKILVQELSRRIDSYFRLVVRNLRDGIPKAIGFFLVRATQEQMQFQLYNEIMKNSQVMQSMDEPEYITQERDTIKKTLATLKQAQKLLKQDPQQTFQQSKKQITIAEKAKTTANRFINAVKDAIK
ncbi:hypothetical protein pb186bvf_010917 [Paramecium bursaria]